ncbi:MAG: hypothetical protein ABIJ56_03850 [Pseudomonadota bacterium]
MKIPLALSSKRVPRGGHHMKKDAAEDPGDIGETTGGCGCRIVI